MDLFVPAQRSGPLWTKEAGSVHTMSVKSKRVIISADRQVFGESINTLKPRRMVDGNQSGSSHRDTLVVVMIQNEEIRGDTKSRHKLVYNV